MPASRECAAGLASLSFVSFGGNASSGSAAYLVGSHQEVDDNEASWCSLFIVLITRNGAPPEGRFLKMKVVSHVKLGGGGCQREAI